MSTTNKGTKRQHAEDDPGEGSSKRLKTPFNEIQLNGGYKKGGLSYNFHGGIYQLKILMLFMKRALKQKYNFLLGTEVDKADKLDDVVFQYTDQNGNTCYRFLQAKHKQEETEVITASNFLGRGRKGAYGLQKYFKSYLEIKKTILSDGELKDFIICTNINLDLNSLKEENIVAKEIITRDAILEVTVPGKTAIRYKLKIDRQSKLYGKLEEAYINFQNKPGQLPANYSENPDEEIQKFLNKLVLAVNQPNEEQLGHVIEKELGEDFNLILSHLVTNTYMNEMLNWFKKKHPGQFLAADDGKKIFDDIQNGVSSLKSIGISVAYQERLKYRYSQFLFLDDNIQYLIEFLENPRNKFIHLIAKKCTALTATKILQALERVQKHSSLYREDDSYIFIRLETLKYHTIEQRIIEALHTCKLLIIDCESVIENTIILRKLLHNIVIDHKYDLKVIVISLDKLKLDHSVTNHPEYVNKREYFTLNNLSDDSQQALLQNKINFQGQDICIAKLINSEHLKSIDSELLLSLVDDSDIVIGEEVRDLGEISSFYISRMLIRSGNSFRENNFIEAVTSEKLVCLSDAAGTGKSVFLTRLARVIKMKDPSLWVVRIDLNDHVNELEKLISLEESRRHGAIDTLATKLMRQKYLSLKLLKHRCKIEGRVVLLLDGVDEISPSYKKVVFGLVKALELSKIQQIVMTTRPHMKDEIESELCLTAFTLKCLTKDDQVKLLTKFWRNIKNVHNAKSEAITEFAKKLLRSLSDIIDDERHEFTGIPLLIRIVAESYAGKVQKYRETTLRSTPVNVKLTNLYRDFVRGKFEIFYIEKVGLNSKNLAASEEISDSSKSLFKMHEDLAIIHLFQEEAKYFFTPKKLREYNSDRIRRTGIVIDFINSSPKFIHRTFAEYFAASFLENKLKCGTPTNQILNLLLTKIAKNSEFVVLRSFIDELLENSKRKRNILISWSENLKKHFFQHAVEGFCQSITEGKASLGEYILHIFNNDRDICGKLIHFTYENGNNLLHQTIKEVRNTKELSTGNENNQGDNSNEKKMPQGGREKSLKLLFKRKCDILAKNEKGETPLHLAVQVDHFRIIQCLINNKAAVNALNNNGDTALHYSVQLKKDNKLVEELLCKKQIEINKQNADGKTALHIAVVKMKSNKAVFLIERNADLQLKDKLGNTILHYAAAWGDYQVMKKLIWKQADVHAKNKKEKTPLHMAVESYSCKLNTVKLLFMEGASISATDIFGRSVLDCANRFKMSITENREISNDSKKKITKEISKIITFLNKQRR